MNRTDNSKYLLYIEPKASQKSAQPVDDDITAIVKKCLYEAAIGTAPYSDLNDDGQFRQGDGWRGYHRTDCGKCSSANDYLLYNGMITNSLCVFYLRYYRDVIPDSEMKKVHELCEWAMNNIS